MVAISPLILGSLLGGKGGGTKVSTSQSQSVSLTSSPIVAVNVGAGASSPSSSGGSSASASAPSTIGAAPSALTSPFSAPISPVNTLGTGTVSAGFGDLLKDPLILGLGAVAAFVLFSGVGGKKGKG